MYSWCLCLFPLVLQTIGAEIAAHELTVEEMRKRNVANLPPTTADGKAARGGTMLDQLQVTLTSTGEHQERHEVISAWNTMNTDMFKAVTETMLAAW